MDRKRKRTVMISSMIAILFIAPLIVLAVVYYSNQRTNSFKPAKSDIQVKEGDDSNDELIKDTGYTWIADGDYYKVDKPVQIYDKRNKNSEYLRVRFVPVWHDNEGNVCGGITGVSDYSEIVLCKLSGDVVTYKEDQPQATQLCFKDSSGTTLLSMQLCEEPHWSDSWSYSTADQCFYYNGKMGAGEISSSLLTGAKISKDVFDSSEDYALHIEVLADAVQQSGDPKSDRNWSE